MRYMTNFIALAMVYMHIIDDYVLQGILAQMKCKSWWDKNVPDPMYANDCRTALCMHSLSWAFSIMLPIAVYYHFELNGMFITMFFVNAIIHWIVDNLKANKKAINLYQDQMIHLIQIWVTSFVLL